MTLSSQSVIQSWRDLAAATRGSERFHVAYAAFRSILRGHSPSREELAGMTPLDPDAARTLIETMLHEGRLRMDQSGDRVTGAGGLSLEPARQSLVIGDRTFGTWCALDAVGIPAGLGIDATVSGSCDDTGDPVRVEIVAGEIASCSPDDLRVVLVPASVAKAVYTHL